KRWRAHRDRARSRPGRGTRPPDACARRPARPPAPRRTRGSPPAGALLDHAQARAREAGMRMVMVETGDDPGHEPARRLYESAGYQRWPVARYFADLASAPPSARPGSADG